MAPRNWSDASNNGYTRIQIDGKKPKFRIDMGQSREITDVLLIMTKTDDVNVLRCYTDSSFCDK